MRKTVKNSGKIKEILAQGLFPVILIANLLPTLNAMTSSSQWADFNKRLVESINIEIDEEKFREVPVIVTAYSSTASQTDQTPFVTAANTGVRDGVVAANFLKFHTKIKIPQLYGDKVFRVEDRMNRRFDKVNPPRVDVWLPDYFLAKGFGVKKVNIVILD